MPNLENEIWTDIKNYEGLYQVSNMGRVKSLPKKSGWYFLEEEKLLSMHDNGGGYLYVDLYDSNGKRKRHYVHRLVAMAFVENPNNYPIINHKDENRSNNRYDNLEWCTYKYNLNYGQCNKKMKIAHQKRDKTTYFSKKVICTTTGKVFNSVKEAAQYYNIMSLRSHISRWCNGNKKFNYLGKLPDGTKLKWMYYEDYIRQLSI